MVAEFRLHLLNRLAGGHLEPEHVAQRGARIVDDAGLVVVAAVPPRRVAEQVVHFARLAGLGLDSRAIGAARVSAVGPKTAASLAPFGIKPALVPPDYKGEGVVEAFRTLDVNGKRVLFPRADRAREVIPAGLAAFGAEVVAPVAYRNITPAALPAPILQALERFQLNGRVAVAVGRPGFNADIRWMNHYGFRPLDMPTLFGGLSA